MENSLLQPETVTIGRFQRVYEKLLCFGALILAEYHLVYVTFREFMPYSEQCQAIEQWYGLVLVIAAIIYLIISLFSPQSRRRVRNLFRRLSSYEQLFLVGLFFWYIVSVAVRQKYFGGDHFRTNDWWMFITGVLAFVLFPMARFLGTERFKVIIEPMLKSILIPHIILFAWTLWHLFHFNYIVFPSGYKVELFMPPYYIFSVSIGVNQNRSGAFAAVMIGLCLYMIITQKPPQKLFYALGTAVYLLFLILTNSRGSWYSVLIMFIFTAFFWGWNLSEKSHLFIRIILGISLALGFFLLLTWLRERVMIQAESFFDSYLSAASETVTTASPHKTVTALQLLSSRSASLISSSSMNHSSYMSTLSEVRGLDQGLAGRESIYKACFSVMFSRKLNFLFGVTPADVGAEIMGLYGIDKYFYQAHNIFIQMGISFGVPTMIAMVAFMISLFVRCIRICFVNGKRLFQNAWIVPVVVACLVSMDMMESYLNSGPTVMCAVFYLFAGWIVAMDEETREKRARRKRDSVSE